MDRRRSTRCATASAIILRILRESGKPQALAAPQGMFQQMLGGKTAQMLRLRLDPTTPCVPEISANKYVLNIRFLAQNGEAAIRGRAPPTGTSASS